jgi:hypothetical protein
LLRHSRHLQWVDDAMTAQFLTASLRRDLHACERLCDSLSTIGDDDCEAIAQRATSGFARARPAA